MRSVKMRLSVGIALVVLLVPLAGAVATAAAHGLRAGAAGRSRSLAARRPLHAARTAYGPQAGRRRPPISAACHKCPRGWVRSFAAPWQDRRSRTTSWLVRDGATRLPIRLRDCRSSSALRVHGSRRWRLRRPPYPTSVISFAA